MRKKHWSKNHIDVWYNILKDGGHTDKEKIETLTKLISAVKKTPEPKERYFDNVNDESIVIGALQLAKECYANIRDGSSDNHVQDAMESKVVAINEFMTRTITEDEE